MCDEDRAGAEEERFAPIGHVRDVGSEADDLLSKTFYRMKLYGFAARENLYVAAAADDALESLFDGLSFCR